MSKYSTEELVKWTRNLCTWDMVSDTLIRDAIIAKLRAADKLCEEIKKEYGWWHKMSDGLSKAIADYEGKK